MAPEGSPASVPSKAIWRQMFKRSSLNTTTWSSLGVLFDFLVIVARLREEAGDLDGGSHGNGAGVRGDGARRLMGGASVGVVVRERAVLSVVVWRPGSERRHDLSWSHWSETQSVGAADANDVGTSVGFGLRQSENRLVDRSCELHRDLGRSDPRTQTALGCRQHHGLIGIGK